jgi:hypothetical protein
MKLAQFVARSFHPSFPRKRESSDVRPSSENVANVTGFPPARE